MVPTTAAAVVVRAVCAAPVHRRLALAATALLSLRIRLLPVVRRGAVLVFFLAPAAWVLAVFQLSSDRVCLLARARSLRKRRTRQPAQVCLLVQVFWRLVRLR